MVWIENLVSLWLKISLSVGAMVLVSLSHGGLGHIEWAKLILLTRSSSLLLVDLHQVIVVVQVFTATELLHHDHLVLSHLGGWRLSIESRIGGRIGLRNPFSCRNFQPRPRHRGTRLLRCRPSSSRFGIRLDTDCLLTPYWLGVGTVIIGWMLVVDFQTFTSFL